MKIPLRFLMPVLAGAAAFAAAFALRRLSGEAADRFPAAAASSPLPASAPAPAPGHEARAWALARAERDPFPRMETMTGILAGETPAGLRALADREVDDPEALALILRQWARSDPRAAAQWAVEKERDGRVEITGIGPVIEVWADKDPAALTAWFKEPGHERLHQSQLPKLIGAVFARDPAAALALAADFPVSWRLPGESMAWIQADPAAATKACFALPVGNTALIRATARTIAVWAETDGPAAAAWAAARVRENRTAGEVLLEDSLAVWAAADPPAAAAFFSTLPPGEASGRELVKAWAAKDPEAALRWAGQANPHERAGLIGVAVAKVAETDLTKASTLVSQMEDGVARDQATAALTAAWAAKDPGPALAWATELPAGPARDKSLAEAASAWARRDAAAAAAWARDAPAGTLPPSAYGQIMWHLADNTPAAYEWLNSLPEGPASQAMNNLFLGSGEGQANAALALPEGKYKARIVERAASAFFQSGPDQALAWALSLPDAGQRQEMRAYVEALPPAEHFSRWNQVTAEKKAELLRRLP